jgi:virginiamycin B lyase
MTGNVTTRFNLVRAAVASALVIASFAAFAAESVRADNYIYWGRNVVSTYSIARANLDGTGVNTSFIPVPSIVGGLAFNSANFYWATASAISRANLDGTGVTSPFFNAAPAPAIAIDSQYIYWNENGAGGSAIARANLDGTGANTSFIPLPAGDFAFAIAIDSSHLYFPNSVGSAIERANLDGTGLNSTFITGGITSARGVAVNGSHVYWADQTANTIGRANLDGTGVTPSFISGADQPTALAVDSNYVYWYNRNTGNIGRANLDGTGANQSFVTGASNAGSSVYGIAVAPAGAVAKYALSVTRAGTGSGTVTSSPAGVDCGSACSAEYDSGTSVTLTAAAASGSTFAGWGGACSGAEATCTVSMSEARSVTASFDSVPPTPPSNTFKVSVASTSGNSIRSRVTVPGPGKLSQRGTRSSRSSSARASAASVCSVSRTASKAGTYTLTCKVNSATRKAQKKGKVRVLLRTTFTPTGGTARTVSRTVTLPSKKPRYTG